MTHDTKPPAWLEAFEADFSAMLRTPLRAERGVLKSAAQYAPSIADAVLPGPALGAQERLAVYNRQYWYRLLNVLQNEYTLTTKLLGAWTFNHWATRFLLSAPPQANDLAQLGRGLAAYLAAELPSAEVALTAKGATIPTRAVLQAAALDAAFRDVFCAPEQPEFAPRPADVERLEVVRLRWAASVRLFEEDWPLVRMRRNAADSGDAPVPLLERHAQACAWAIYRTRDGHHGVIALEPLQAKLYRLLEQLPLGEAMARIEQASAAPADLAARVQSWFAQGVRLGFWIGFAE